MTKLYIVAAKRTAQGRFLGALADKSAVDLACAAGEAALEGIDRESIDYVIVGNVLSSGQGMNMARQVGVRLGIPVDIPAFTINMMCASGMQAVILAAQTIRAGEAKVVLCGGSESMSNAPYLLEGARTGYKLGDASIVDAIWRDGLVDSFDHQHMGLTAERLATDYQISRQSQDSFAVRSQQQYAEAKADGRFKDELMALNELDKDEHPRPDTTIEKLATLKPVFDRYGTVTAGNASGINDGAAMLIVCDEKTALEKGWQPLASIRAWATAGCDPKRMGLGPVYATRRLCERHGLQLDQFDTIEINEAFAAQTLACIIELGLMEDRLNPDGGAIAMGHPIGASGARLLAHLAWRIARGQSSNCLATLCVGGGMGAAVALTPA